MRLIKFGESPFDEFRFSWLEVSSQSGVVSFNEMNGDLRGLTYGFSD